MFPETKRVVLIQKQKQRGKETHKRYFEFVPHKLRL